MSRSRIRLLGALEIELDGVRVEARLPGAQSRLLLAYLVLNRDRAVRRTELEDALWGDHRPAALDALSPPLSRLRRVIGAERLKGRGQLRIDLGLDPWIDAEQAKHEVARAREALAAGDAAEALAAAEAGSALLGHELLEGLDADWLRPYRDRAEELRAETLELQASAAVALGTGLGEAETAARAAIEIAPFRESARVALLEVLRAQGNVAEALLEFEAVRSLLRDQLGAPPGPTLLAAHHRLLQADGTPPAPTAPAPQRTRWPHPLTALVGRAGETGAVETLLLDPAVRLVTLTGPGGIGKTRLAVEAGGRLATRFPDGVHFVELEQVRDPELFAEALAGALGIRRDGSRATLEDLSGALRHRRSLLVLDNFEQVTDAAVDVRELLAGAPDLKVLATSRTLLQLAGERQLPVPALDAEDGVRLFLDRARNVDPAFSPTTAEHDAIRAIVRALDGLPLAIELAAARVRLWRPPELLARLDDQLDLLTSGTRDAPERQRTLRDTIAWSHALLTPAEQELFARLSVFAGGFDVAAAEAVDPRADTADVLDALVRQSLVSRDSRPEGVRLRLLSTIATYARERAIELGVERDARDRHADHYAALAPLAAPQLRAGEHLQGLHWVEREAGNLRAATAHLFTHDPERATELSWALWIAWWLRGSVEDARRWATAAVAVADQLPTRAQARALLAGAYQFLNQRDTARASELLERSAELYAQTDDTAGAALASAMIGHVATLAGDLDEGERRLTASIAEFRRLGDPSYTALLTSMLGWVPSARGDLDAAARIFADVLATGREIDETLAILMGLSNLGKVRLRQGDTDAAWALFAETVEVAAAAGDVGTVAWAAGGLAATAAARGEPDHSALLRGAATALLESAGSTWIELYAGECPDRELPAGDAVLHAQGRRLGVEGLRALV